MRFGVLTSLFAMTLLGFLTNCGGPGSPKPQNVQSAAPVIASFSAAPASITEGQSAVLSWSATGATTLSLDQGIGVVTGNDQIVTPRVTTTYTLTASGAGGTTTRATTVTVTAAPDTQPPSVPTELAVSSLTPTSLILTWTASTDNLAVTGYRIHRSGTQVGTSATTGYSDSGLSPATAYTYTVAARDAAENWSAPSAALTVTTATATQLPFTYGVSHTLQKFRPGSAVPSEKTITLDAARNEFESFQIVLNGGGSGCSVSSAQAVNLTSGGNTIASTNVTIYREGLINCRYASNSSGASGLWPDPLIPSVDPYYRETRNAFPTTIPANETRAILVDVYVPLEATPGVYNGAVNLQLPDQVITIPYTLRVRRFALPSTATVKTAFGLGWDVARAHYGGPYGVNWADPEILKLNPIYALTALDHRISLASIEYGGLSNIDPYFAFLMNGTPQTTGDRLRTILPGAKQTTFQIGLVTTTAQAQAWRDHFAQRGWLDTTVLFHYTCDEPPNGCGWPAIRDRGIPVQQGGVPTLVTTDISSARSNNVLGAIDILVPLMNWTTPTPEDHDPRSAYDSWLAESPNHRLWWYISCMSHGCGPENDCVPPGDSPWTNNWPDYVIDATAMQARCMSWHTYAYDIGGELYFSTNYQLETAWDNQCAFGGNGDGTMFYPGTPARIGGTHHIPITSLRMKLIREGMEDYEYLHLLRSAGDAAMAKREALTLFTWHQVNATSPEQVFAARARLADRIESLLYPRAPKVLAAPGGVRKRLTPTRALPRTLLP